MGEAKAENSISRASMRFQGMEPSKISAAAISQTSLHSERSSITWPREVKEMPCWVWAPIMTDSIKGTFTG